MEGFCKIINALNVVPKAHGKWRPILDLRPLNKYTRRLRFSMETLQRIRPMIKEGDWVFAIDLSSAFDTGPAVDVGVQ